ncbi:MAG: DUF1631 domain-containing protein [Gammaproteobacteria bacterium]|nr:DUF1631 domain-containing protein [Gammaproteobacteria bacterium]
MSDSNTNNSDNNNSANTNQNPNNEVAQPVQDVPYAELIENILTKLEEYFSEHTVDLFKKTDEFLFNSANTATSIDVQNRMFEFMNGLRAQKDEMEKNFIQELSFYLQPVSEIAELPKKKKHKKPGSSQFSLVEQDEMDEMVTLTTISSKAAQNLNEELTHLHARLQRLALHNSNIFHANALEPVHICDAFQEAAAATDFDNKNKLVLFKKFGEEVVSSLKELYDEINQMMIDEGILPEIELSGVINPGSSGYGHGHEEEADIPEEEFPEEQPPVPPPMGGPPPVAGPRRAFGSGAAFGGNNYGYTPPSSQQMHQGGAAGQTYQAPMEGSAPPAAGPRRAFGSGAAYSNQQASAPAAEQTGAPGSAVGDNQLTAGIPAGQVRQEIQNFIGGVPSDPDSAAASAGGSAVYYSHGDVVSALSNMQVVADVLSETPLRFDADAIKKAVLTTIGDKEGGTVTKRVNQVSEKTIDFIKLIFDAIIEEDSITDTIKTLLLSLQIPIIKAAMLDADFFVDDKHPARQLLDKLAEAGVGVTDHKDPVYIEIEKIVKKLLTDYKEDIVAFEIALKELNELTEGIYKKAREKEVESQKQVKHTHARNIVLQEIRKITLGKELPHGVRTLVLKVWPSLMFNHYLNNGKANDEWVEMLMILEKIIESVQPIHSTAQLEELGLTHDDILDATRERLKQCQKSGKIIDRVLADLNQTYVELMETTDLPEEVEEPEEVVHEAEEAAPGETGELVEEAVAVEPEPVGEDPEVIARRKIALLPNDVQAGAWFIVYNGEDKPVRRLKLAVILIQDATLVFVDHLGNVVIEKDAEVFADEIEKGLSGVIMQHSVFDHALNNALSTIKH